MCKFDDMCDIEDELAALNWRAIDPKQIIMAAMLGAVSGRQMNAPTRKAYWLMRELDELIHMPPDDYWKMRGAL